MDNKVNEDLNGLMHQLESFVDFIKKEVILVYGMF